MWVDHHAATLVVNCQQPGMISIPVPGHSDECRQRRLYTSALQAGPAAGHVILFCFRSGLWTLSVLRAPAR
jgi:hypothetical protein